MFPRGNLFHEESVRGAARRSGALRATMNTRAVIALVGFFAARDDGAFDDGICTENICRRIRSIE